MSKVGPGGGVATTFATGFDTTRSAWRSTAPATSTRVNGTFTVGKVGPGGGVATTFASGFSARRA